MWTLTSSINIEHEIFKELRQEKKWINIFVDSLICLILKLNVHERMLGKGRLQASNKEISGMNPEIFLTVYGLVEC